MRPPLRLLALLCLLLANLALAQRCEAEMRAPFSAELFPQPATGRSAAKLLQRALDLLEPSLPPLRRVIDLPVARDDPDYDTFSYLADRELLPHPWPAEAFSLEAWRVATARLADWYGLAAPAFDEPAPSNEALLASLLELIEGASRAPQPVALLAADLRDGSRIAFWATLRNHGIYPRMIVLHPPEEPIDLRRNIGAALERLSTCATTLTNYVYAPADTAERLFLATNESRMVIVGGVPPLSQEIFEVPAGDETAYLTFRAHEVFGKERYTALFIGPSVGIPTLLRLLPQVRTNMSPKEIIDFLGG
ncbi:hypothetical protein [Truepera radiovictrix]|uniref:Uncharacterized protein n=1 Tax=Truepera radiovictrix (strain DSM 17093 / CIP 108686 / LMG 22925 / RQ-24) TaxID=649638 RepID=D7CU51_TRURR|nr:hypothetical protein [Truepera radiovictrix]ADI13949.1 hypothetical protein Trad_0815 [Truepera radiovictrix DSM 17093]WMT57487.1 hypothetical protein RCV51_00755 [Truepera radiovictrix]